MKLSKVQGLGYRVKNLVHRRFGCTGVTLPLPGRWQAEIWYCPKGSVIPAHTHPNVTSILLFLAGAMRWYRTWPDGFTQAGDFSLFSNVLRPFGVPRGVTHGATTTGRFGLFLNLEYWHEPKTSAAEDLQLA